MIVFRSIRTVLVVTFLLLSSFSYASEAVVVKHYQQQARYAFGLKVLSLALSKVYDHYEIISPETKAVNEARGERLVTEGVLDLEFMSTTIEREQIMIPIKVPIYRGILGLRLLLIRPERNLELSQVKQLNELRKYVGGHGAHWGDLPVYEANNLRVVPVPQYDSIFKMLKEGRFDYFHRGVQEIWSELDRYTDDFMVAENVMLYYPLPVYFFVSKHRPQLALKLEQGLNLAIEDGSYESLFKSHFAEILSKARLDERSLVALNNPVLPSGSSSIDRSWWLTNTN